MRLAPALLLLAALSASAAPEIFWRETADLRVRILVDGDRVLRRWEYPRRGVHPGAPPLEVRVFPAEDPVEPQDRAELLVEVRNPSRDRPARGAAVEVLLPERLRDPAVLDGPDAVLGERRVLFDPVDLAPGERRLLRLRSRVRGLGFAELEVRVRVRWLEGAVEGTGRVTVI